ncbi:hypothetical protein [Phaeobacter gallaeciensis]|uniref:JmjC domain-containing protein n=2 Tax=Phaeobacter gallaeciensis TaxID=60890 RepID=A0ABD4XF08_9RHOB|nr:hypothetical protein [Phaeobacter gallaeciensis]MDE4159568.1 hypothetical protein [Phaeobacter gallaeciensis]MDE4168023.1 hypothetical protein [Phaeobacter gallaeciensis]MDE4184989.1 hypothetical protein [Phaeobacter gallaeciensis]
MQLRVPVLTMQVQQTNLTLWPTHVSFFEAPVDWEVNRQLADEAIAAVGRDGGVRPLSAAERRVRGILEKSAAGQTLKMHLFACAHAVLGQWAQYLDPDHCENRALVITKGGFISTHKDSREGDLTCVHFLTGGGAGQPVNSVGTPRFVIEDPSRYFDEGRLPFESRHGYSVNPRPGLSVFFPSHIPHNQHPYDGSAPHVQVVANFRVNLPVAIEERLFD